jgi:hypothetical protein
VGSDLPMTAHTRKRGGTTKDERDQWPIETPVDPRREFSNLDTGEPPLTVDPEEEELRAPFPSGRPAFVDTLHMDSKLTTLRFVALGRYYHVQLEERHIGQVMGHAGLVSERGRGYEMIAGMWALIEHYKRHSEKGRKEKDPDKARKDKSDADTAELKARELANELCPMDAAKQFWSDARIELRKQIELATYLDAEQKRKLLEDFQRLKTKLVLPTPGENFL